MTLEQFIDGVWGALFGMSVLIVVLLCLWATDGNDHRID